MAHTRPIRRVRYLVGVTVLTFGSVMLAAPPANAANPTCLVRNLTTHRLYRGGGPNLQRAIDAAAPNTTLSVRGLCVGQFAIGANLVPGESLTLLGVPTPTYPAATLKGRGKGAVVLAQAGWDTPDGPHPAVILQGLTITGGSGGNPTYPRSLGGGIANYNVDLTLVSTSVTGNAARQGGGIVNRCCALTLIGSSVTGNTSRLNGGGIWDAGNVIDLSDGTTVTRNTARSVGGGGIFNLGSLTLRGSASVTGNVSLSNVGGGIWNGDSDIGKVYACAGPGDVWTGALSPNAPDDPPTVTPIAC